jgi:elongation factor G
MSTQTIRNIGISAHIDSGKTTLTERILFFTKQIHRIVEVKDKGGGHATTDFLKLEQQMGITIQSAATTAAWAGHVLHVIDTPGHIDFTVEVERALRVLDGAVMVLCGVAGVQSQSYTVDRQMRRYDIARVAFVNKLDRAGADPFRVVAQLRDKLGLRPLLLQIPIGSESSFSGVVDLLRRRALWFDGEHGEVVREEPVPDALVVDTEAWRQRLVEAVADLDEVVAERFVNGENIDVADLVAAIRRQTVASRAVPVFLGSAFQNKGVQPLLDGVCAYLPEPKGHAARPLVMLAFKVEQQPFGQLTHVRLYDGTLRKGDSIVNTSQGKRRIKVSRLVRMHANAMIDIDQACAGDVVALFGVDCASGDTFTDGTVDTVLAPMHVPEPVVSLAVAPRDAASRALFGKALQRFAREDPTFRVGRDSETGETLVSGMGELHLEVVLARIREDFGCDVVAGKPRVKFRETIRSVSTFDTTLKKQTGGPGQYARVAGRLEPIESGVEFVDATTGGSVPREFVGACEAGFREAAAKGALVGAPVVGVRFVLEDGATHSRDSSDRAFHSAAILAFREAHASANPVVLEPVMRVEVVVPSEFQGTATARLLQRRGSVSAAENRGDVVQITAEVPLDTMFGFAHELRSSTQGKGEFTMEFARYAAR